MSVSAGDMSIEITGLEKAFGSFKAVTGVDIAVPRGAFLVIVGPSGCGKSTMLRMLAGLEAPTGGAICFEGREVANGRRGTVLGPAERNCGLVFQSYALWPHMTVAGNVDWPLKVAHLGAEERRARTMEVLELLGISALADRYPNEISGGQQQRVAIARMIAPRPKVLLFDEPLSNLDAKLRVEMRAELMRVHRATGATSVYVTHDQIEALTMATHVAIMKDGRVEQFGPPQELLDTPRKAFVATFMGTPPANLVPVETKHGAWCFSDIKLCEAGRAAQAQLMYRADRLDVTAPDAPGVIAAETIESVPVAGRMMVTGLAHGLRLTAVIDAPRRFDFGERIGFRFPSAPDAVFSEKGERL